MPLYTLSTQDGALSLKEKSDLAAELTAFHCKMTGLDPGYVKIIFDTFEPGDGFVGGQAATAVTLTVLIRQGRAVEYKKKMLESLWEILQRATDAADDQILLAIQEAPASNAMEMGVIMPDLES